jgi:(2Fe-2S) ferredoxin
LSRHFFVCINNRPPFAKPSCGTRGSAQILQMLQEAVMTRGLMDVAVTATGCLGPCDQGPTIVVYPEGVWYTQVRPEDVPDIIEEHMVGGKPVQRLEYEWPQMSG